MFHPVVIARQGDVGILTTEAIPGAPVPLAPDGSVVLAHGEVTGHRHRFGPGSNVTLSQDSEMGSARMLIDVGPGGAVLVHEEHAPVPLTGRFEVRIKCEYDPSVHGGARRVED